MRDGLKDQFHTKKIFRSRKGTENIEVKSQSMSGSSVEN